MAIQTPMMRSWRFDGPGSLPKTLYLTQIPRPSEKSLGPKEVLVEVYAAGINPAEYKIPKLGQVSRAMTAYPKTPGCDFSGRVLAVGKEVTDIKPGNNVFGNMNLVASAGSLCEYVATPYETLAKLPDNVALDQAGAGAVTALTAYQTIAPFIKPGAGDKVFLNGGAGGAGTFGIQIAKALGCHVTVTCSTAKIPLCKQLGADEIIDYRTQNVVETLRKKGKVFKVVVDNVGSSPANLYAASDDFLMPKPDGHFQFVGGALTFASAKSILPKAMLPGWMGGSHHKLETFFAKDSHENLVQIAQWIGEGKVKPVIDSVFPFEEVPKAYEKLIEGRAAGKIMIQVKKE